MGFLTPSANGTAVKINNEGDTFQGTVSGPVELRQTIDFNSKQPAFYKNGNPKVEAVVPMTGVDGQPYRVFVPEFGNLKDSMVKAAIEANTDDFYVGSQWTIKNTGKQPTNKGMMAHTYAVTCHNAGNQGEGGTPDASQVKLATASAPAAQAAPANQPFGGAAAGIPAYGTPAAAQMAAPAQQGYPAPQMQQPMMQQPMQQQAFNNGGYAQPATQQPMMQQAPAAAGVNPWQEPPY